MNKLALGTVQFGTQYGINNQTGKPSEAVAFSILDLAAQNGIQFLDTAAGYGESQKVLGNYFRSHPLHPFQVMTKFSGSNEPLLEQLKKSLKEMSLEKVYSYSFHRFSDLLRPGIAQELKAVKKDGLISKIGISIYTNDEFKQAIDSEYIDVIQIPFNLLDNWSKKGDLIVRANEKNKEIHVRSVFLQGLFYKNPSKLSAYFSDLVPAVEEIQKIASAAQVKINALALRYALNFSQIDRILIGVETLSQLEENLKAYECIIPEKFLARCSAINVIQTSLLDPRFWK